MLHKSKRATKKAAPTRDPKKDRRFKQLAEVLQAAGFTVRREKLKAGSGWKAVSGSCRLLSEKLIFVDPRMTQDDQLLFLEHHLREYQLEVPAHVEGEAESEEQSSGQEKAA